jgi:hypothetical protein
MSASADSIAARRRAPGARPHLFDRTDIAAIAADARLSLAPRVAADAVAFMLDRAFASAVAERPVTLAMPAQRRDAARKLLAAASHLAAAIAGANAVAADLLPDMAAAAEVHPAAIALRRQFGCAAVGEAFLLGPTFVSLLIATTPEAAGSRFVGGRARKDWLRGLEDDLVVIFELMFGRSAASGEHYGAPVARWMRSLCRVAERAASDRRTADALAEITDLADETIALYMRRAVTRARRRS